MVVHLVSPDGSLDSLFTSNYALLQIRDELARVDGVGDINVFGAREYSMRIWLDPNKISSRGLTAQDVVQAIQEQNVQVAAGIIGAPPVPKGATAFQYTVNTQGRLADEKEFGDIIIKTGADGQVTRVRDVARVELAARDYTVNSQLGGKPATAIGHLPAPRLERARHLRRRAREDGGAEAAFPAGLDYTIVYDPTVSVRESIHEVQKTLFEAIALVVLVVLVFLQTWRASLIPLIAIPVSLIGTFAAMAAFGFSINNISLFGIVLAIGIVVDDAIVVVEAIEHHIENGLSPRDAARKAMDEVGGAVGRDRARALRGLRPDRVHQRHHRAVLSPIRAHHRGLDRDLRAQFAHAFARARRAPAQAARREEGFVSARDRWPARLVLQRFQQSLRLELERLRQRRRPAHATRGHRAARLRRPARPDRVSVSKLCPAVFCRRRIAATRSFSRSCPTPRRSIARKPSWTRWRRSRAKRPAFSTPWNSPASISSAAISPTPAAVFLPFKEFSERTQPRTEHAGDPREDERARSRRNSRGFVVVFPPPPVAGIGNAGGYRLYIQDRGNAGLEELQAQAFAHDDESEPDAGPRRTTSRPSAPTCRSSGSMWIA